MMSVQVSVQGRNTHLDMNLTQQGFAATNDFLYLALKCLSVCGWFLSQTMTEPQKDDKLKKGKGGILKKGKMRRETRLKMRMKNPQKVLWRSQRHLRKSRRC